VPGAQYNQVAAYTDGSAALRYRYYPNIQEGGKKHFLKIGGIKTLKLVVLPWMKLFLNSYLGL